jgi:hypothetical protein
VSATFNQEDIFMAYYETSYGELLQLTRELMEASARLTLFALDACKEMEESKPGLADEGSLWMSNVSKVHMKLHKHFELEVKDFEDLDTHFGKKLATRVGKLQLIFQELADIQRNMHEERDGSAEDRLLDQLEMDNMRWCEEVSMLLKEWYKRRTHIG